MKIILKLADILNKSKKFTCSFVNKNPPNLYSLVLTLLVIGVFSMARLPKSFLGVFLSCFVCVKLILFCKNKMIGGGYFILTVLLCNIPARLILKSTSKDMAIIRFPDFIHQNLFFFALIFSAIVISLIIKSLYSLITIKGIKRSLNCLITVILFSPVIISLCYLLNWSFGNPVLGSDAILAFYQTNISEASSYFSDFVHIKRFIFVMIGTIIHLYLSYKMALNLEMRFLQKKITQISTVVICIAVAVFFYFKYNNNMVTSPFIKAEDTLEQYKIFNNLVSKRESVIKKLPRENDGFDGTYVIVIGESECRSQMGVYGYRKNTTPWQSEIKESSKTIFFENAYSCHTHTVPVLTYALTQKNQYENSQLDWKKTVSLIDVAKFAGNYNTVWLSNQGKIGLCETPISSIADTSEQQYWTDNDWLDASKKIYDEELVKHIDNIKLSPEKNLIVIHLMGCHGSYSSRYPATYDVFSDENKLLNSYNNSIYYNDHVLKLIYDKVKKIDGFKAMIYFSDHGDDAFRSLGHNSAKFTWDMAKIPFWMIFSEDYYNEHSEIIKTLKKHEQTPFTNDLIFETVLGIIGVTKSDFYNNNNDLSSELYKHSINDLTTLYGKKFLSEQPSKDEIKKLWLHRVDSPEKLLELGNEYYGLEFDVVFHENVNDFENSHDRSEKIVYSLDNQLKTLSQLKNGVNKHLWIDFKNLTHDNKYNAEKRLSELFEKYEIKKENCYVESNNWKDLDVFKEKGWKTSYYFPYYDFSKLTSNEIADIKVKTKDISYSDNVSAISFAQEYYGIVTEMDLNPSIDFLTWFNGVERRDFEVKEQYLPIIRNPRVKVILVRELGHYTR